MSPLLWSDALALNLAVMDDTHREFVAWLAVVATAPDERLVTAWEALTEHTDRHFAQEDRWMRQTGFSSVNCHSTQHAVVLASLREGLAPGGAGQLALIRRMAHELAVWFPGHAQSMDAALALHLRGVGFDTASGLVEHPAALPAHMISGCGSSSCSPVPASTAVPACRPKAAPRPPFLAPAPSGLRDERPGSLDEPLVAAGPGGRCQDGLG